MRSQANPVRKIYSHARLMFDKRSWRPQPDAGPRGHLGSSANAPRRMKGAGVVGDFASREVRVRAIREIRGRASSPPFLKRIHPEKGESDPRRTCLRGRPSDRGNALSGAWLVVRHRGLDFGRRLHARGNDVNCQFSIMAGGAIREVCLT